MAVGSLRYFSPQISLGSAKDIAMPRSLLDQEEMETRAELEAVIQYVQSLHAIIGAMMADIAAIRNTVFDDRESMESYQSNLKLTLEAARPAIEEAMSAYEEFVKDIGDAPQWQN